MTGQIMNRLEIKGTQTIPEKYTGPRGYSAYEIAVQEGYEGSMEEWISSLHGDVDFADLTPEQKESLRGPAGKDGRDGEDAVAAINPKGNWDSETQYEKGDYVTYLVNGNAYVCLVSSIDENPVDNPLVWQVIALKGAKGDKGEDGLPGLPGVNGKSVTVATEPSEDGHNVTFTDVEHSETIEVKDGDTPVRGEDYWTETDKSEIKDDVLEGLGYLSNNDIFNIWNTY